MKKVPSICHGHTPCQVRGMQAHVFHSHHSETIFTFKVTVTMTIMTPKEGLYPGHDRVSGMLALAFYSLVINQQRSPMRP